MKRELWNVRGCKVLVAANSDSLRVLKVVCACERSSPDEPVISAGLPPTGARPRAVGQGDRQSPASGHPGQGQLSLPRCAVGARGALPRQSRGPSPQALPPTCPGNAQVSDKPALILGPPPSSRQGGTRWTHRTRCFSPARPWTRWWQRRSWAGRPERGITSTSDVRILWPRKALPAGAAAPEPQGRRARPAQRPRCASSCARSQSSGVILYTGRSPRLGMGPFSVCSSLCVS